FSATPNVCWGVTPKSWRDCASCRRVAPENLLHPHGFPGPPLLTSPAPTSRPPHASGPARMSMSARRYRRPAFQGAVTVVPLPTATAGEAVAGDGRGVVAAV